MGQGKVQQPCALQLGGSGEEAEEGQLGRDSGVSQLLAHKLLRCPWEAPKKKVIVPESPLQADKKEWDSALNLIPSLGCWVAQLPWGLSGHLGGTGLHFSLLQGAHIIKVNFPVC